MMPSVETIGTAGTRNARSKSGREARRIQTPAQTSMNANSVPILVISPTMSSGMNAPKTPVNKKKRMFDLYGVLNFGCTSEKVFGTSPSRLRIENARLAKQHHENYG